MWETEPSAVLRLLTPFSKQSALRSQIEAVVVLDKLCMPASHLVVKVAINRSSKILANQDNAWYKLSPLSTRKSSISPVEKLIVHSRLFRVGKTIAVRLFVNGFSLFIRFHKPAF